MWPVNLIIVTGRQCCGDSIGDLGAEGMQASKIEQDNSQQKKKLPDLEYNTRFNDSRLRLSQRDTTYDYMNAMIMTFVSRLMSRPLSRLITCSLLSTRVHYVHCHTAPPLFLALRSDTNGMLLIVPSPCLTSPGALSIPLNALKWMDVMVFLHAPRCDAFYKCSKI